MKPFLATDANIDDITFPVLVSPKIDGVRGIYLREFSGRSLKPFKNLHTQQLFSDPKLKGFDGELSCGLQTSESLCRDTTSALNRITGTPTIRWNVFDFVTEKSWFLPFEERQKLLFSTYAELPEFYKTYIIPIGHQLVTNKENLLNLYEQYLLSGYEGAIIRKPEASYKFGRSTQREQGYLRIKNFDTDTATIINFTEGAINNNPRQINELGLVYRTSHKENKIESGMIGALVVQKDGKIFNVSSGKLSHEQRKYFFKNFHEILGKTIEYKYLKTGIKDKPRMATFQQFV